MRNNLKVSCFLSRNLGFLFFFLFLTFGSLMKHEPKFCQHEPKFPGTIFNQADQKQTLSVTVLQQIGKVHDHQYRVLLCTFSKTFHTFHRTFYNMLQIIFEYSLDFSKTFPEQSRTFTGMFGDIPMIVSDIPQNFWRHSQEYNILPIPRVPCILFPVPVFLVLYIAVI